MIKKIKDNIIMLYFENFGSCVYLIKIKDYNILIDTSSKDCKRELLTDLKSLKLSPDDINIILITHHHYDHDENINIFKYSKVFDINNYKNIPIKDIKTILVPGHTKDSIAFYYKKVLFSGDTIFNDGFIGRTDFKESVPDKMNVSVKKLRNLKFDILCPGHL